MANVIVGIHGLANKPERDVLEDWWKKSIREGLAKNCGKQNAQFDFKMVYWADLLHSCTQHQDSALDFDDHYNNEPYREADPGALRPYESGWWEGVRTWGLGIVGQGMDRLRRAVRTDAVDDWVLGKIKAVRDLDLYYDKDRKLRDSEGQMREAREVLMDVLKKRLLSLKGQRIMLIAHSMGSIIAYDVLRDIGREEENRDFELAHFVTIGSPLGLSTVKKNVYKERKDYSAVPLRTPTVVRERWVNYADRHDPVALDQRLRNDYGPNERDVQVQVEDDIIHNDYIPSPEGERKPHKSYGYLRTPEISEHIREFLGL